LQYLQREDLMESLFLQQQKETGDSILTIP
jgi:hypothetical protein